MPGASSPVIEIRGLRKSYGDAEAVRGIDLQVEAGEVFALLGPNGAGKTTTVEILEGYRRRSGGEVSVLGEDPERAGRDWRQRIGIVLQSSRPDPYLTVREALALYAGYYEAPRPVAEVIELVGLEQQGRHPLAQALRRPAAPARRRHGAGRRSRPALPRRADHRLRPDRAAPGLGAIAGLRDLGKTIFLTTHYMDEAQRLADRVTIIAAGEIVARGTPEDLGDRENRPATISYRRDGEEITLETADPVRTLHELTGQALEQGVELEGLAVSRPSLEDVYLELTEGS